MDKKDSLKVIKFPKRVNVLGRPFKILFKETIEVDGKAASGSVCVLSKEIWIEDCLPLEEKIGILAHEMAHAGLVISGLDQTFSDREIEIFCQLQRTLVEDFFKAFK